MDYDGGHVLHWEAQTITAKTPIMRFSMVDEYGVSLQVRDNLAGGNDKIHMIKKQRTW